MPKNKKIKKQRIKKKRNWRTQKDCTLNSQDWQTQISFQKLRKHGCIKFTPTKTIFNEQPHYKAPSNWDGAEAKRADGPGARATSIHSTPQLFLQGRQLRTLTLARARVHELSMNTSLELSPIKVLHHCHKTCKPAPCGDKSATKKLGIRVNGWERQSSLSIHSLS